MSKTQQRKKGTRAGAGRSRRVEFQTQMLHDGSWWSCGSSPTLGEAKRLTRQANSEFCNGNMVRVNEIITTTEVTQVWDATVKGGVVDG